MYTYCGWYLWMRIMQKRKRWTLNKDELNIHNSDIDKYNIITLILYIVYSINKPINIINDKSKYSIFNIADYENGSTESHLFLLFKSLILLHLIRFKEHLSTVHFSTFKKKRSETTRKGNLCMKKMLYFVLLYIQF